jgi:hypothetical protein
MASTSSKRRWEFISARESVGVVSALYTGKSEIMKRLGINIGSNCSLSRLFKLLLNSNGSEQVWIAEYCKGLPLQCEGVYAGWHTSKSSAYSTSHCRLKTFCIRRFDCCSNYSVPVQSLFLRTKSTCYKLKGLIEHAWLINLSTILHLTVNAWNSGCRCVNCLLVSKVNV